LLFEVELNHVGTKLTEVKHFTHFIAVEYWSCNFFIISSGVTGLQNILFLQEYGQYLELKRKSKININSEQIGGLIVINAGGLRPVF